MASEKKEKKSKKSSKSSSKSSDESEDKKKKDKKKEKKEKKRSSSTKKSRKSSEKEEPSNIGDVVKEPTKKVESTLPQDATQPQLISMTSSNQQAPNFDLHKLNFIASRTINNHVYEKQLTELQFLINSKLIPTKQSLLSQLYKIQSKMTLVRKAKDKLCNEYKVQMDTLINNLALQESNKMLVLKQDESSVLNHLNQIQVFSNKVGLELTTQGRDDIPANADYSTFTDISNLITESMFLSEKNLCLSIDNPSIMTTLLEYDQGDMKDLTFYKYK